MTIEEVIDRMPGWGAARPHPVPLGGGITNVNYRVDVEGESFVVRIPGAGTERLGIDRGREHACTVAAGRTGVGPEVAAFLEPEGILVTRFIEGAPFPRPDLPREASVRRAAKAIRRFHGGGEFPGTFSALDTIVAYLDVAGPAAPLPPGFPAMLDAARRIDAALRAGDRPVRPCHNDLLAANFLDDGRTLRILDWEYSAHGDPYFDLGNFAAHLELDAPLVDALLEVYEGQATPAGAARVSLMRILSDLREAMWAMVQLAISQLDYDFAAYGRKHFDRCAAALADPGLPARLALVRTG